MTALAHGHGNASGSCLQAGAGSLQHCMLSVADGVFARVCAPCRLCGISSPASHSRQNPGGCSNVTFAARSN
jgi:hypothetical protein